MSVTEQTEPRSRREDDDTIEIRLSDIVAFLKKSRRAMLIGALIGGILGTLYAFSLPNQYTSQVTVLPEIQSKGSGGLSGSLGSLAGLAGLDVGGMMGSADAIRPDLYPNILQSIPFTLEMLKQPVFSREFNKTQPLSTYLEAKSKSGLLSWFPLMGNSDDDTESVVVGPKGSEDLQITKAQEVLSKTLQQHVTAAYEKKTGVLTITAVMPDPRVAAMVARLSLTYLTDYITTYRTEKARREVTFLSRQVAVAKQRYQEAEYSLSAYRDKNRSVYLNTAKIEEQRIQAEFLLAQDLYNTLSKQAEMAKIKVQEETPVFKILEPARVPLKKSGPKRLYIIFALAMAGLIVGIVYSLVRRAR